MVNDLKLFRGTGLITCSVVEKDTYPDSFHIPDAGLVSVSQLFSEAAEPGPVQAPAHRTDKVNAPQCR